jgi:tyrosine aminotransferase
VQDVVLTHGGVGAISLAILGLANRGDNILLPCPGFSYYNVLCESYDLEIRSYNLLVRAAGPSVGPMGEWSSLSSVVSCMNGAIRQPEKNWEADLTHMQSLIDTRTKAIVIINPGNPSGTVFSKVPSNITLPRKALAAVRADHVDFNTCRSISSPS